jgi:PAS domain S-box-containing protein
VPEETSTGAHGDHRFRLLVESVKDYAIFMLDPDGRVLTWNTGAQRIKGYTADEIIGRHFSCFYPPDAQAQQFPQFELEEARRTGSFEDEGWRVRKDGTRFWANVVITALYGDDGRLVGYAKVTRDLTQRREHEESLRRSEERFRLLIEGAVGYAIFMLDANGHVMTWNTGAQRIQGYTAGEIIGQHLAVFYPDEARNGGWPEHALQVAAETGRFDDEGWHVRRDGSTYWAQATITSLRDPSGRLVGYAKLTRDLSERKRAEALERDGERRERLLEAERSARAAAQRSARLKDEFLSTLSHELRTPLSAILGWTQVLKRSGERLSADDMRRGIEVIDRNARAQSQLIDDLLDLSRVMSGKIRLDVQQVAAGNVVRAVVESVEPAARAKEVALEVALGTEPATIAADAARLQQIVWNLVTNAVKFTPRGGRVKVALRSEATHVELSVSDTGIGIPRHFLPHVFDRFSQRDSSTSRVHGGLGLGLAIAKQLVELHGGTIRADSAGEGAGATFTVELPLSSEPMPQRAGAGAAAEEPGANADLAPLPTLAGMHVVVVDDEADARDLIGRALVDQGARVFSYKTAEEALQALRSTKADVVVSDIGMPTMDGYQFMRALRSGEAPGERAPALALTAFAGADNRKRALLAGYQAHLAKPFDLGELVLVVAGLVGR